jgi:biotin-dependent carboxylase-like uncharacterized protein
MRMLVAMKPGLLTTVQDLGRDGFGAQGISPSGAADAVSLQLGNLLVENDRNAAALEMTLAGGTFIFPLGARIALTGSDFGATLNGAPIELFRTYDVAAGGEIFVGPTRGGARSYLCIGGGIDVVPFLGSASTHLLSGLGGFEGRTLKKGDTLMLGNEPERAGVRKISEVGMALLKPRKVLRVTVGPQADWFSAAAWQSLLSAPFRVSEDSNRMGLRLDGPAMLAGESREMITEGVCCGAIQITSAGQPIILFVEQQTTGGYPKIANVIGADLHSVGQLRPRDEIHFAKVSMGEARALWIEQQQLLRNPERLLI